MTKNVYAQIHTYLWDSTHRQATTNNRSWSMNDRQVVCSEEICFLYSSAFPNNHSFSLAPLVSALPTAHHFLSFINLLCKPLFSNPSFLFFSVLQFFLFDAYFSSQIHYFPCSMCALYGIAFSAIKQRSLQHHTRGNQDSPQISRPKTHLKAPFYQAALDTTLSLTNSLEKYKEVI